MARSSMRMTTWIGGDADLPDVTTDDAVQPAGTSAGMTALMGVVVVPLMLLFTAVWFFSHFSASKTATAVQLGRGRVKDQGREAAVKSNLVSPRSPECSTGSKAQKRKKKKNKQKCEPDEEAAEEPTAPSPRREIPLPEVALPPRPPQVAEPPRACPATQPETDLPCEDKEQEGDEEEEEGEREKQDAKEEEKEDVKEEDKDCEEEHDGWKDVIKKRSVSDLSNETNKRAMKVVELRRRRAQIFKRMGVLEENLGGFGGNARRDDEELKGLEGRQRLMEELDRVNLQIENLSLTPSEPSATSAAVIPSACAPPPQEAANPPEDLPHEEEALPDFPTHQSNHGGKRCGLDWRANSWWSEWTPGDMGDLDSKDGWNSDRWGSKGSTAGKGADQEGDSEWQDEWKRDERQGWKNGWKQRSFSSRHTKWWDRGADKETGWERSGACLADPYPDEPRKDFPREAPFDKNGRDKFRQRRRGRRDEAHEEVSSNHYDGVAPDWTSSTHVADRNYLGEEVTGDASPPCPKNEGRASPSRQRGKGGKGCRDARDRDGHELRDRHEPRGRQEPRERCEPRNRQEPHDRQQPRDRQEQVEDWFKQRTGPETSDQASASGEDKVEEVREVKEVSRPRLPDPTCEMDENELAGERLKKAMLPILGPRSRGRPCWGDAESDDEDSARNAQDAADAMFRGPYEPRAQASVPACVRPESRRACLDPDVVAFLGDEPLSDGEFEEQLKYVPQWVVDKARRQR